NTQPLGIIHRDVSPHNLLISRDGQVKLSDFGLARASISTHTSQAGVIRGKYAYMPKEQAHGRKIDHRVDIFAAGATFYETLCGRKPYSATNLAQQIYQLEQPIPPPSFHNSQIPPEIDELTLQALSPDPEDRYSTAKEMANDLRHALSKFSTLAEETRRLAELVNAQLHQDIQDIPSLPSMDFHELPISRGTLIENDLVAARQDSHSGVSTLSFDSERKKTDEIPPKTDPTKDTKTTARWVPKETVETPHTNNETKSHSDSTWDQILKIKRTSTSEETLQIPHVSQPTLSISRLVWISVLVFCLGLGAGLLFRLHSGNTPQRTAQPQQKMIGTNQKTGISEISHDAFSSAITPLDSQPNTHVDSTRDLNHDVTHDDKPHLEKEQTLAKRRVLKLKRFGYLSVITETPARIVIDDVFLEKLAPAENLPLKPGIHRIKVIFPDQQIVSDTKWVKIEAGQQTSISF
ncbi:MAG: serine/threonine-protein kinase, partial [Pseudomonadota bacterium]